MKQYKIFIIIALTCSYSLFAQDQNYKLEANKADRLVIQQLEGKIEVIEHSGTQLEIFSDYKEDVPEKAKGLKPIGRNGMTDNSGIGLEIVQSGNKVSVSGVSKQSAKSSYTFKVPKGMKCKIDYTSPFASHNININGFSSELEISTLNSSIYLDKVTGPLLLNAINGVIVIKFAALNQNAPISVTAINGEIEVELPSSTPANLNLGTIQGEIYTDFDIDFDRSGSEDGLSYIGGGRDIEGNINGGGVDILLKTINNNIYLRKK